MPTTEADSAIPLWLESMNWIGLLTGNGYTQGLKNQRTKSSSYLLMQLQLGMRPEGLKFEATPCHESYKLPSGFGVEPQPQTHFGVQLRVARSKCRAQSQRTFVCAESSTFYLLHLALIYFLCEKFWPGDCWTRLIKYPHLATHAGIVAIRIQLRSRHAVYTAG